jgi:primosomal protein N' (replication factor Y)
MGKSNSVFYYEVVLALPAIWKNNIYTYESATPIQNGAIVFVPFGSAEKSGVILKQVNKPSYSTKPITKISEFVLPSKAQSFLQWMSKYYPGTPGIHIQHFIPAFLNNIPANTKHAKETVEIKSKNINQKLTHEQQKAYRLLTGPGSTKASVLHGITGSGKTRLYCELAKKTLSEGKDTLIMYPEISLTTQLKQTLVDFFGSDIVSVYHSKRTKTEQRKTWITVQSNEKPKIIIGPRSALFLPYKNLGLVVVDEAHDGAYKQDSGTYYSGIIAAGALAKHHNAQLILGSATPPVQETEQILSKGGSLVCMHTLAKDNIDDVKNFNIIDMTKSENLTKSHLLSKTLVAQIKKTLQNKKQTLLFLNKRGTARMLLCESCGWHASCPDCEMPLTHHHDSFTLQCHICGFKQKSIITCLGCNHSLTLKNPGIKAVEQDLKALFLGAVIARFDSDNKKKDSFQENYETIKSGGADIIIGTQLITKGLDLPLLDTVGILQADSALLLPDYTSEERTFQQLTQVSGRVGRGHSALGTVVVQTYQPKSYIFPFIAEQNWHGFYEQELQKRKENNYPPYSFAMKIWVSKNSRNSTISACNKLADELVKNKKIRLLGPAPSFYEKASNKYTWQLIITANNRDALASIVPMLPKDFYADLDPVSFL